MTKSLYRFSTFAFISLMTITSHAEIVAQQESAPAELIRVVLDITRGVQQGCIYKGQEEPKCFRISGGRNQAQTFNSSYGKVRYCSYTTMATDVTPQLLQRKRRSNEFKTDLEYFVSFDEVRGVGTHAGDTSGYSGSCIRIANKNAKALYDLVKENSVLQGQKIISSNVRFDIIDNTKDRIENECECITKHIRHNSAHKVRADKVCTGTLTGDDLMADYKATLPVVLERSLRPRPRPEELFNQQVEDILQVEQNAVEDLPGVDDYTIEQIVDPSEEI